MNMKTRPLSEIGDGSKGTNSWGQNPLQRIRCEQLLKILIGYRNCGVVVARIGMALPLIQRETKKKFYRQRVEKGNWGLGTLPGLRKNFLDLNFEDLKYVPLSMVVVVATVIVFIVCEATWDFK